MKGFQLQNPTLDVSPRDVAATIKLGTTVTAAKDKRRSIQRTKELFSAAIPDAGITVPGIFNLGAFITYEVGISAMFAGTATFQSGLSASLPDTAKLIADISAPDQSSASGFDSVSIKPIFDVQAVSASVTMAAFTQPTLAFGIELTKIGRFEVNVNVKLPIVSATLEAAFSKNDLATRMSRLTTL